MSKPDVTQDYQGQGGFTLVELMAVLVILGVLASIAVPKVNKTIRLSREKACMVNLEMIEQAVERFGMDQIQLETGQPDYSGIENWDDLIPDYFDTDNKIENTPICPVDGDAYILTLGGVNSPAIVSCNGH